jgi:hypothetical protein
MQWQRAVLFELTRRAKPGFSDKSAVLLQKSLQRLLAEARKAAAPAPISSAATRLRHMLQGHLSSCKKILDEKLHTVRLKEQKDGRSITKMM